MLYKFKSKATADLIMLEPNGKQILRIIGKEPSPKGILEVADMLTAIERLREAVRLEEEMQQQADIPAQSKTNEHAKHATVSAPNASSSPPSGQRAISLRQRAAPFIEMLQRAHKAGQDVVWGA